MASIVKNVAISTLFISSTRLSTASKQLPPFSAILGNADVIGIIVWTLSGNMWHAPQPYGVKPAWGRG
jgi:hypothetical protein